jgi:hypothetical protein
VRLVEVRGIPHLAKNERDVGHPYVCGWDKTGQDFNPDTMPHPKSDLDRHMASGYSKYRHVHIQFKDRAATMPNSYGAVCAGSRELESEMIV